MDSQNSNLLPPIPEEEVPPTADAAVENAEASMQACDSRFPREPQLPESVQLAHGGASFNAKEMTLTLNGRKGDIILNAVAVEKLGRALYEAKEVLCNLGDCSEMKNGTIWTRDLRLNASQHQTVEIRVFNKKVYWFVCSYFLPASGGNSLAGQTEPNEIAEESDSRLAAFLEAMRSANEKPTWCSNPPFWLDVEDYEPLIDYLVEALTAKGKLEMKQ